MNPTLPFRQIPFHWGKAHLDRASLKRHPEPMRSLRLPFINRLRYSRGVSRGGNPPRAR